MKTIGREPITAIELWSLNACKTQLRQFERRWPEGCEITLDNLLLACRLKLDTAFMIWHLPDPMYGKCTDTRTEIEQLLNLYPSTILGRRLSSALAYYATCSGKSAGTVVKEYNAHMDKKRGGTK